MDPQSLIDSASTAPLPAPFWFIQVMKALGFVLHMVPMNLWYAGLLVGLVLHVRGSGFGSRFAARLLAQMPVLVALGVNFGIVPLLFLQLAYNKAFYPATVLMAWPWLAVIAMLIPAYYGVYLYAFGLKSTAGLSRRRRIIGWVAAALFVAIGFVFANAMSLMANVERWPGLYLDHQLAGAATGTALNLGDPTLVPRWLLMFGLALGTTAVWAVFDAAWFAGQETEEYRRDARGFAWKLYLLSAVWVAGAGAWYMMGTWPPQIRAAMLARPVIVLTALTAVSPALPALWLLARRKAGLGRLEATMLAVCQVGVLALNAVSRQIVQNLELRPYLDVAAQPVVPQWGPMIVFLAVFAGGLGLVFWMLAQIVDAHRA